MRKIIIIGSGGSGKSTLARKLSKILNIKVYHLDMLLWKPNWIGVSREEQIRIQNEILKNDEWIIDGNYSRTIDLRINAADTIIFLDLPRIICLFRVFKRYFKYLHKSRPDMVEGNKERINFDFLKWIWNYPKVIKPIIMNKLKDASNDKKILIMKSPKDIKRLLKSLP